LSRLFPDDGLGSRAATKVALVNPLASEGQRGLVTLGGCSGLELDDHEFAHGPDAYWTPNEYLLHTKPAKKRNGLYQFPGLAQRHIARINALVMDIDGYKSSEAEPINLLPQIVDDLLLKGIPLPHLAVLSGRGIHLYWLLETSQRHGREKEFWADARLWRRAAYKLSSALQCWGCDHGASTRLGGFFRIPGTPNSSAPGAPVGAIEILPADHGKYTVQELDASLPYVAIGSSVRDFKAKEIHGTCPDPSKVKGFKLLQEARRHDLQALVEDRIARGFEWSGMRNNLCFLWGQCFRVGRDRAELLALNARLSKSGSVDNETNIRHVTVPFVGQDGKIHGIYRLRNVRFIRDLQITDEEMVRLRLRTLISSSVKWQRRRAKETPSLPDGRQERSRKTRTAVEEAVVRGVTDPVEIAKVTGKSLATVYRALKPKPRPPVHVCPAEKSNDLALGGSSVPAFSIPARLPRPPRATPAAGLLQQEASKARWKPDWSQPVRLEVFRGILKIAQEASDSSLSIQDMDRELLGKVLDQVKTASAVLWSANSLEVIRFLRRIDPCLILPKIEDATIAASLLGLEGKVLDWCELQLLLVNSRLLDAYLLREIPSRDIALEMEFNGIPFNLEAAKSLHADWSSRLASIKEEIAVVAGESLPLNDEKALAFRLLKLLGSDPSFRRGRRISFDKKTLLKLSKSSKLARLILRYRELRSALSGPLAGLMSHVGSDQRVHGTYCIGSSVTGRIQVRNPNLQGINKDPVEGFNLRSLVKTSSSKTSLVRGDFRQFDLHILAHVAGCKGLKRILENGGDLYLQIAREIHPEASDEEIISLREASKAICYLIFYGGQAKALSQSISVTEDQAQRFIDAFFESFPEVRLFTNDLIQKARLCGYVQSLGGRRRAIQDLCSSSDMLRNSAERKVLATFIQATASDIVKEAMVDVSDALSCVEIGDAKMVLQVHDELILEVSADSSRTWESVLRDAMEGATKAFGLRVPVRISAGRSL
jgi:hypothetical protein